MTNYFGATPVILADDTSGGNVSGAKPVYLVNASGTPASLSGTYVPFRPTPPDHTVTPVYVDSSSNPPAVKGWNGTSWATLSTSIVNNGDGTLTLG